MQAQEKSHTAELKKLSERLKSTEKDLKEAVHLTQKMKNELQERTAEFERLAKASDTVKPFDDNIVIQSRMTKLSIIFMSHGTRFSQKFII